MTELAVPFCRTYKVSWETEVAGDYQITVMVSSPVLCVASSLTRHVGLPKAVPAKQYLLTHQAWAYTSWVPT